VVSSVPKKQTDALGQEIRVGDILLSASKTGNVKVGRVEKIHDSGYITVKFAERIRIFAYERGAPDIEQTSARTKTDEHGVPIRIEDPSGRKDWRGQPFYTYEREEYTYMRHDYTVVGHRYKWKQEEAAHYARFVVKSTADHPLFNLAQFLELDYDTEEPAISTENGNDENIVLDEELNDETLEGDDE
jgi:hypothetical protein